MGIVIDADVLIRGEKRTLDLPAWTASLRGETFEIAAITVAELWHGLERASPEHRSKLQRYLESVVASLPVIPYTDQIAYTHARIWAELESSGNPIGPYDLIVAATAIERGSAVATFNKRHFSKVKGLKVIEPK